MSPETAGNVVIAATAGLAGLFIGTFFEFTRADGVRSLQRKLKKARREVEELREYIWLITAGDPTTQSLMKAGALPDSSVQVERSRRLTSIEGGASE